jgi:putative ABC transport system ATP-binding protein
MNAPAVRIEQLTKIYDESATNRPVLKDVNATFDGGKFTVLLGRSGSGKSTLLNLISGIDVASEGTIWIGDQNVTVMREQERTLLRRTMIGFVFQFFNLIPTLTAWENVSLVLELSGSKENAARAQAQEWLERVGLSHRFRDYPDRLSGGEQQRVAIARALAHNPQLILADEPTGNLDEENGAAVLDILLSLVREGNKTLIMATHSLDIVPHADAVFRVTEGHVVRDVMTGYQPV